MREFDIEDLDGFLQPSWNSADSLPNALRSITLANDKKSSLAAYNQLLYAIGNNHAGTYYPVILAIIPVFERILSDAGDWSKYCVIEALIDLTTSFSPEPGCESFLDKPLADTLRSEVVKLRAVLESIQSTTGAAAASAGELLKALREAHIPSTQI